MGITKALIIADPWIAYILDGSKTWEMRSSATAHRGWFGLIRKGTGAVYGVARLVDVGMALSPAEMIATFDHHRIPEHMIRSGEVAKWNRSWKLADVRRLDRPVPYKHKPGAVTWVELNDEAIEGIASQLGGESAFDEDTIAKKHTAIPATNVHPRIEGYSTMIDEHAEQTLATPQESAASLGVRRIGEIEINDANLRNDHFYLRPLIDKFPGDVIGGSNKATAAPREVAIDWGGPEPVSTDIDGGKKFFRARGWIGAFYKLYHAEAGDFVVIEETAPYRYRVSLKKSGMVRSRV